MSYNEVFLFCISSSIHPTSPAPLVSLLKFLLFIFPNCPKLKICGSTFESAPQHESNPLIAWSVSVIVYSHFLQLHESGTNIFSSLSIDFLNISAQLITSSITSAT